MYAAVHHVQNFPAVRAKLLLDPLSLRLPTPFERLRIGVSGIPGIVPCLAVIQNSAGQ